MLTQTLPFFGNTWCKDIPLITRFMKGIFFSKPPIPKYKVAWDVTIVLRYLSSLYPLESLSLKSLTLKTVALVALATAPRAQTLVAMSIDFMLEAQHELIFCFPVFLKTSRQGSNFTMKIEHYIDEKLCPMHTLLFYLEQTSHLRVDRNVFISYVTFKSVTTSTIARWLKTVLSLAGIDTTVFKAHSYRSASTSKAASRGGCSLRKILETANWTSDKNFKKFYQRNSVNSENVSYIQSVFR